MRRLQLRTAHASKRQGHGRAPAQWSRRSCQRCVWCAELSLLAPPAFEQPNELASPIIVSGGAITPCGAGGVESSNGEQHETSKAESPNTSKPASSAPLNAPAQALSGDETKRRTFRARRGRRPAVKQPRRR